MFKNFLCLTLRLLAKATLRRYRPMIIGVTGSVGKTSTKEAIYAVLKNKFSVRRNIKNYNNEIGVPLTILGQEAGGKNLWRWLKVFLIGFFGLLYTKKYPKILVLEMGADKIGDIAYLTDFVKCDIGVVTAVGEIPVHVEFFQGPAQVAREKSNLVRCLSKTGWAILNYDDEQVRAMAARTTGQVFTYGFSDKADLRAFNLEQHLEEMANAGLVFKVDYQGNTMPIKLRGIFGQYQAYAVLAAAAVGLVFKINLVEIAQALKEYRAPAGRLRLLRGIKNSWILDDTYNSSPSSALGALGVLEQMPGRKIAALGDMLELGAFTEEAHRKIGVKAAGVLEYLLAVGERSIFLADEAKKNGLPEDRIRHFASAEEAGCFLQEIIQEGDVILVKGSQGLRMEKIVKEIMAEPDKAKELLVRQDEAWFR
ncbi:MAG TPA: hypothetical protein DHI91_02945 [Candidatus Portnoybacteria bacterium]|uniref:UDP-N-acetylmuramoyl-tripeptide--D-alanyl-D-alanine ligase n=1 Tax=Candidatus Portnoybacteria bacterium CG02_land_8_20_14_3_00_45_8 TaxID=1974807 RepID=A0A2M7D6W3_9BACT|nr:MAG: hypothetical protein COS30_00350 [Candidatus Portnoybacteria bacterium CG02_land_8_20_14_3_00_45_8]HCX28072.1 hypothetical protein [Candidatus Portnoybacteria bacterium]